MYCTYRLHLWCDNSQIILLHLQGILCHAHFWFGQGERASWSCSKIAILCFTLAVHCLDLWSRPKLSTKPSGKPGALMALEWWQLDKKGKKKMRFVRYRPFSHNILPHTCSGLGVALGKGCDGILLFCGRLGWE